MEATPITPTLALTVDTVLQGGVGPIISNNPPWSPKEERFEVCAKRKNAVCMLIVLWTIHNVLWNQYGDPITSLCSSSLRSVRYVRRLFFSTTGSTCTLVFRRVFAHAHAVLPLLWHMQGVARFLLGEAPCNPPRVNRLGGLALSLGQMG
jgi:hypothetical protein